jgi:hypothetical protein
MFCSHKEETYIIYQCPVLIVGLFMSQRLLIRPQIIRISGIIGRLKSMLQISQVISQVNLAIFTNDDGKRTIMRKNYIATRLCQRCNRGWSALRVALIIASFWNMKDLFRI